MANNIIVTRKDIPVKHIGPVRIATGEGKQFAECPPELTHTKDELRALWNAIHYTHQHKMKESMERIQFNPLDGSK